MAPGWQCPQGVTVPQAGCAQGVTPHPGPNYIRFSRVLLSSMRKIFAAFFCNVLFTTLAHATPSSAKCTLEDVIKLGKAANATSTLTMLGSNIPCGQCLISCATGGADNTDSPVLASGFVSSTDGVQGPVAEWLRHGSLVPGVERDQKRTLRVCLLACVRVVCSSSVVWLREGRA